jgi:chorismate mutase
MRPDSTNSEENEMTVNTEELPDIDDLRHEIDRLDAEILAAVERRPRCHRPSARSGWPPGAPAGAQPEMKVIERYSTLGPEGKDLAMLLLRMGRGRLGH